MAEVAAGAMLDLAREGPRASKGVMRLYRLLLYLYPASFRADYGEEMAAIFRIELRAARGWRTSRCGSPFFTRSS